MKLLKEVWDRRFAIKHLVLKNFRVRYRNMALGVVWSVLNPLVMLGVLVFIFTYVFPNPGDQTFFPIFLLIGLVHYNSFARMISASTLSIVENGLLIKKVAFPRIIIPVTTIFSQIIDVLVLMALLTVFVLIFQVPIGWSYLWIFASMGVQLVFTLGLAFITSSLHVYYRDMMYIVESGLTILFWLTPIFYSLDFIYTKLPTWLYGLYILNPLCGSIHMSRLSILQQGQPDVIAAGIALCVSLATFVTGVIMFQTLQRRFADYM
jgi:lipopolysaccharide transport system permease protein